MSIVRHRLFTTWTRYIHPVKKELSNFEIHNNRILSNSDMKEIWDTFENEYDRNLKEKSQFTSLSRYRETRLYGKEERVKALQTFYNNTRKYHMGNIDSHDNSLYHKSIRNKSFNIKASVSNKNLTPIIKKNTIQSIVDDYNRRWKKNITVEDYYKNFKN